MALTYQDAKKRLEAAQALLLEPSISRESFSSLCTLVKGINAKLDAELKRCQDALATLDKVREGDVIMLSAENLPENTEEQKKRKKYLLLFLVSLRQLRSEITRVEAELEAAHDAPTHRGKASHWDKIFSAAKGPFGIVTVVAVGIVLTMNATAVDITIQNTGCGTMYPSSSVPVSLPGFSLPQEPIPSGGSAVATLPGLPVAVDGSTPGVLSLKVVTYTMTFQLPNTIDDVRLNGMSLLGKNTNVSLSEHDSHTLELVCS